jgi:hypothetical protein
VIVLEGGCAMRHRHARPIPLLPQPNQQSSFEPFSVIDLLAVVRGGSLRVCLDLWQLHSGSQWQGSELMVLPLYTYDPGYIVSLMPERRTYFEAIAPPNDFTEETSGSG